MFCSRQAQQQLDGASSLFLTSSPSFDQVCEPLLVSRNLRRQLMLLRGFVAVCPEASAQQLEAAGPLGHLLDSASTFSLHDLQLCLSGRLVVVRESFGFEREKNNARFPGSSRCDDGVSSARRRLLSVRGQTSAVHQLSSAAL